MLSTRGCLNCKKDFIITPDDFGFYEKIKVPPPTLCSECRMQRRFSWRNERTLHRNTCAATDKNIISSFAMDSGIVVYDRDYWWSDAWEPTSFGQNYDFSKSFFEQYQELMHRVPFPAVFNARTTNCDYSNHTGESKNGYLISASWNVEDCAYCSQCGFSKDFLDCYGVYNSELCYEDVTSMRIAKTFFSQHAENCTDSYFLYDCKNCIDCFGCIGLRNKQYCILNKQYSKEEYEKLREQIITDMKVRGEYGEFFPIAISPFGYNETIAQDYFPLTKEQALAKGYKWRDAEKSSAQITKKSIDLPDHIKDVDDEILKEIIECVGCHKPYRFIKKELDFLKRFNLALPRKCFECRHQDRFHQVNFPRLYHRPCMKEGCANEFETSYPPERPETVYCESCYQAEVV